MTNPYFSNLLRRFYKLTQKVRLIWALCAVILIMFGLDFSPIMSSNVGASPYEYTQALTVVPGSNLPVRSQSEAVGAVNNASTQLAQATINKPQGQVKAVSAVSIPASRFSGVYLHQIYGWGCAFPGCPTYPTYDPTSPKIGLDTSGNYHTWATFPLSALPSGQAVFSAKLRNFPLSCSLPGTIIVGPYASFTFYFSSLGTRDPSTDSYKEQFDRSGGYDTWNDHISGRRNGPGTYNGGSCPSLGNLDLGTWAVQDITTAKSLVNRFSFGIAGSFVSGGWSYSQPIGTNFVLDLTYGIPGVDLKVNGSNGPITVAGGSNLNLTWDVVGYDTCAYNASPAWYTPGWPVGQQLSAASGSTSTKIYYENVTYSINCRNTSSGTTESRTVTVNVTP